MVDPVRRLALMLCAGAALCGQANAQLVGDVYFLPTSPTESGAVIESVRGPTLTQAPIDGLRDVDFAPEGGGYAIVDKPVWAPMMAATAPTPERAPPVASTPSEPTSATAPAAQSNAVVAALPSAPGAPVEGVSTVAPRQPKFGSSNAQQLAGNATQPQGNTTSVFSAQANEAAPPATTARTKPRRFAGLWPGVIFRKREGVSPAPSAGGPVALLVGRKAAPPAAAPQVAAARVVVPHSGPPVLGDPRPVEVAPQPMRMDANAGIASSFAEVESPAEPLQNRPERGVRFHNPFTRCTGDCGIAVYGGPFLETPMTRVFGVEGFTAPWDYEFADAGIIAAALSRPVVTFGRFAEIEPEIGIAQRFGEASSTEVWGAVVLRWNAFPWDRWVDTSVGLAFGVNYAFKKDALEERQDTRSDLEHLLAFTTPEIAFRLHQFPQAELLVRLHHRSGGRDYLLGPLLGSNEAGGAQFLTAGVRWRF